MRHLPRALLALGAIAAAALGAPVAAAQDHGAEDAAAALTAQREQQRLAALSPQERTDLRQRRAAVRRRADAVPPEEGGAWSAPFPERSFGINAALLPTGRVLVWSVPLGRIRESQIGVAWIWDPAAGTGPDAFTNVDPPLDDVDGDGTAAPVPIFCSGQSFLPDGRLLLTGGARALSTPSGNGPVGWEGALTFNPFSQTWTRQPDMPDGRFYPSQVMTQDGATYIVSGYTDDPTGGVLNHRLERFTPSADLDGADGVFEEVGTADFEIYPHTYTLPGGKVGVVGPRAEDVAVLDPATSLFTAGPAMSQGRIGGAAVLQPDGIAVSGGHPYSPPEGPITQLSTAGAATIDLTAPSPAWAESAPLVIPRSHHNTVLLPDGGVVAVGGGPGRVQGIGERAMYDDGRTRAVELWDAGGQAWRLGAAQAEDRGYHSVALLLPDGRVLSAGDDIHPDFLSDTIELYSPPYLFRGDRPVITAAPVELAYGQRFIVEASGPVERAVLMAPGATTHGVDMSQRHVELAVDGHGGGLAARLPTADLAPPGWYMLFVLNGDGVPSVARWVHLSEPDPPPPAAPADSAATGSAASSVPSGSDAPAPPPSMSTPPDIEPRDGLAPALRLRAGALRAGRVRFWVSVDEPASLTARLRAGRVSLGTVRATLRPGTRRLRLRVRRRLPRRALVLSATVRDAAGNSRRAQAMVRRGPP